MAEEKKGRAFEITLKGGEKKAISFKEEMIGVCLTEAKLLAPFDKSKPCVLSVEYRSLESCEGDESELAKVSTTTQELCKFDGKKDTIEFDFNALEEMEPSLVLKGNGSVKVTGDYISQSDVENNEEEEDGAEEYGAEEDDDEEDN